MALGSVSFNEYKKDKNGDIFEFYYEGRAIKDNINQNKIQELIRKFMNMFHGDMVTNVKFLRTIFREYDEKVLVINYQSDNLKENVRFNNSQIFLYEKTEIDLDETFSIKLKPSNNIDFTHTDNIEVDYSNASNVSDRITKVLQEINCLNNVKAIELDLIDKTIIEAYKLFYNENPDFSDKSINIKIHAMILILAEFNVSMAELKDIDKPISFRENAKNTIIIVGEEIRNAIELLDNKEEALIKLSNEIYASRYNLTSTVDSENIESNMKLIKSINTKIHS